MAENKDRRCKKCGGLDEFVYEVNWVPVYYCGDCDSHTALIRGGMGGAETRVLTKKTPHRGGCRVKSKGETGEIPGGKLQ
jgi:hypothetical protein